MILTFFFTHILPANPVRALAGPNAPPAVIAALEVKFGLNKPLYVQFVNYMAGTLTGNLGVSIRTGDPVLSDIEYFLPATLELAAYAFVIAVLLGTVMGSIAAIKKGKVVDHALRILSLLGLSMPSFWLGIILIVIFSVDFRWFPGGGRVDFTTLTIPHITGFLTIDSLLVGNLGLFEQALAHLALPAFVLGVWGAAWITRHTRASTIEVMRQDYITMAKAKGLSGMAVFFRHTLRNSLIPPLTIAGLVFGSLLSAAIPVELVFSWPGIGLYTFYSVQASDYDPIIGAALVTAIAFAVCNLVVDLLYPLLDPRIKYD